MVAFPTFVYRGLEEPGFPVHSRSVHLDNFTDLTSVPESTSFYCRVHPSRAEPEESDLSNNAELDSQSKATLVLTPSPTSLDDENETLVLIKMSIDGPLVVARWPVIGGSGYFTVQAGNNCIACQSLDRKFLDIHDSSSGLTRCQIPIPASSLDKNNRIDNWSVNEWLVDFRGAAGGKLTFDCQSGSSIDISSAWGGWTYGGNANEFLTMARETLPSSIPDHLQVRDRADGKVLFEWPIPDPDCVHGAGPFLQLDNLILLATDDGRVLFVEKTNGRIERTFAPRFWVPYLTCVVAFLGLVWLLCWFCFSIEHGFVVWMDAALIASVAFLFLWWRITLAGCYQQYDRMAWTSVAAMLMAIGNLLNHETLYSQRGLVRSTLPLFVFASALLTTIQFNIVRGWYVNAFTMRTVTIGSVLLLGSIVTIRLCPAWNENGNSTNHSKPSISGWRISLRQLMFITFVVATMMATVRWLRLDWSLELLNREGMSLVVMSCVSLALYCAAVRVRYLVFKIVLVSVLLIALTFQATLQLPTAWHFSDTLPNPVRWIEFVGASAVSTILITLRFAFIRRASI